MEIAVYLEEVGEGRELHFLFYIWDPHGLCPRVHENMKNKV